MPLADAKTDAITRINDFQSQVLRDLAENASVEERDTWPSKEKAARAFMRNEATPSQQGMLSIEASLTGEDIVELCDRIIRKAEKFDTLIGYVSGLRRKSLAAIDNATTEQEVADLLVSLRAEADTILAQVQNL